jgi:hypothetical protein
MDTRDILRLATNRRKSHTNSNLVAYNKVKKVEYNGFIYDSKKEVEAAAHLNMLKGQGKVVDWKPQPRKFELIPSFRKNGKIWRASTYTPDFWVKWHTGKEGYYDLKGFKTEVFRMKQKLFEWRYPELTLYVIDTYKELVW